MPPKKGRGGKGGQGQGQAKGKGESKQNQHVCKPTIKKVPEHLLPTVKQEGVPGPIQVALTDFHNIQPFFSAMERLDPEIATHERMRSCWLGISGESITALTRRDGNRFVGDLETVDGTKPVFIKRIHILDPIDAIEGNSVWPTEGALPAPSELWLTALEKLNDPMNEAYVDAVFAVVADKLVKHKVSPHWCHCYGTFPARVDKYLYNISDEYPSLKHKHFWRRNQELGVFRVQLSGETWDTKPKPVFSDAQELDLGDFDELVDIPTTQVSPSSPTQEVEVEAEELGETVQLEAPKIRIQKLQSTGSSGSSASSGSSEESDDYMDCYAEFDNFPVQVTLLEHAEGTMDELLDEVEEDADKEVKWKAWLFQVVAALSVAQHYFGFVHNDLHSNNVMWSRTEEEYLYYRVNKGGKQYMLRVPTFGYIMKVIDFGRATYWLPEPAGFFLSDAFYPGNDASDQYNCEPFFDARAGKKVEPNPSFDLCRLSVSLIESLFPKRPEAAKPFRIMSRENQKTYAETESPLYNMLWEWLLDDQGHNVLRQPDGKERYPDFDLYSAIAANVHKAVPSKQIEKPLFNEYKWEGKPTGTVYDLWV
jgi:hypothetical protein